MHCSEVNEKMYCFGYRLPPTSGEDSNEALLFPAFAANAQSRFAKKIEKAVKQLQCVPPSQVKKVQSFKQKKDI